MPALAVPAVWRPTERRRGFNLQDGHWKRGWVEFAKGVFAFCGEMGPENSTPHNIQMALLEGYLQLWTERCMGWAVWELRGETGVMDSNCRDVDYEDWCGYRLDREMLELLRRC